MVWGGKPYQEVISNQFYEVPSAVSCRFRYDVTVMTKHQQLLLIDGWVNLILGLALTAFPSSLVAFLGLPDPPSAFYPNILGGVLIGIAIALFLESRNTRDQTSGLGLHGAVVINLCGGLVLCAWLLWGNLELPLQGAIFLWGLVILLVGISGIELATKISGKQE